MNIRGLKLRVAFVFTLFFLFFLFISFRLVQLQILNDALLDQLARRQFQRLERKAPFRRAILDRNGEELAVSITANSVYARPPRIRNKRRTAKLLGSILGVTPNITLNKLRGDKPFVWIQRQVTEEVAKKLVDHRLAGIYVEPENKRLYPNGMLAANVLGFTDIDGKGLAGLELALNDKLVDPPSRYTFFRDGRGKPSYIDSHYGEKKRGENLLVTLDRRLQFVVEEELQTALEETGAQATMAIVMDPNTGEILAMGQRPTFDPNKFAQFPNHLYSNRLISHLFEPGSTFKVLVAAEAMEKGLLRRGSLIDCGHGMIQIGNKTIGEAESDHQFGWLPLEKVLRYSSNVGAVRIAQKLGGKGMRELIEKYGFTRKTGIELPGEAVSASKEDSTWIPIFLATVGFGQGISVTPLQMMTAYAVLANGGYLIRPKLYVSSRDANVELPVLSPKTVDTINDILVSAVEDKAGTGARARIEGIRVAGKTGTAQKYDGERGYDNKKYFSSFIGFLPAERPELLIGIMVDEPKWPYYASQVAAPLFKRIAQRSIQILDRIPRREIAESDPPLMADRKVEKLETKDGKWMMPNLTGLSKREVLAFGKHFDNIQFYGNGYVKSQIPNPGSEIPKEVILHFSP